MAEELTVSITARDLSRVLIFPDLKFETQRYSFAVECGPKQATIRVYGSELALQQLKQGLRGKVEIWDSKAERVWWGCLWSVTIHTGELMYGWTLDGMANSVNISYLLQTVNQQYSGSGSQADTGFATDAASIADFGTWQMTLNGGNGDAVAAASRQTMELANRKYPQQIFGASALGGQDYAEIVCKSWLDVLDHRYYTNNTGAAAGIESNEVLTSETMQFLGRAHPAMTTIGFGTAGDLVHLICTKGELAISELAPYNAIFCTGSATANNNQGRVITATRSPGSDYTMSTPAYTLEAPGASITVHDWGSVILQKFTLATNKPFTAVVIDIRIMQIGAPTDQVYVKLYSDAGTTLLATATIDYSEIPTAMGWVTGVLDVPTNIVYGTNYWIGISRTATQSFSCYGVGVDEALSYAGGDMWLWAGPTLTFMARPVDADLIFKISGKVENTLQIADIVTAAGEFLTGTLIDNSSGIPTLPYQDGTLTALQVLKNIAAYGTSNNRRLQYKVTPERVLEVYEESVYNTAADILVEPDGLARKSNQQPILPHTCPYGQWMEFSPLIYNSSDEKYLFVDEAEYDAIKGGWQVIRLRNRASDLDLSRIIE